MAGGGARLPRVVPKAGRTLIRAIPGQARDDITFEVRTWRATRQVRTSLCFTPDLIRGREDLAFDRHRVHAQFDQHGVHEELGAPLDQITRLVGAAQGEGGRKYAVHERFPEAA